MISTFSRTALCQKSEGMEKLASNVRNVFRTCMTVFAATRIVWFGVLGFYPVDSLRYEVVTFLLNRTALLAYFTAFTLIVFYWAERFHKRYYDTTVFMPGVGKMFIGVNACVYVFQIIIVVLYLESNEVKESNPIYELNILADALLSGLVSITFFIYGWLQFCKLTSSDESTEVELRRSELHKIMLITLVFTACFTLRVIMFLYRPLTNKYLNIYLFYSLAYFVPEISPTVLQVYLSETVMGKQQRDSKFIDKLYADNDSDIADYRESVGYDRIALVVTGTPAFILDLSNPQPSEDSPLVSEV